jgi:hypothetical protein
MAAAGFCSCTGSSDTERQAKAIDAVFCFGFGFVRACLHVLRG